MNSGSPGGLVFGDLWPFVGPFTVYLWPTLHTMAVSGVARVTVWVWVGALGWTAMVATEQRWRARIHT